jgi:hypothetical protein
MDPRGGHDLSCVVHVHSTYSDGSATVPELLADARAVGAGALLLTDHDTLAARRDGWEGWHDGVLLLVGDEVSPRGGHLLAFGLETEIDHRARDEHAIAAAVAARGGAGFAAHPFSDGGHMLVPALARRIVRPHGWRALDDLALTGLELWSLTTDAAEHWGTPRQGLTWIRHPERLVDGPPTHHLAAWDRLCGRRRMPAIGGLDAHQAGLRLRGRVLSPLPNRRMFALLRTHLICRRPPSGRLEEDRDTVLDALREGSAFLSCPHRGDPRGACFWAEGEGIVVSMGGEGPAGPAVLRAELPRRADVRLIRDGSPISTAPEVTSVARRIESPGAYRLEARIAGRLWLLSNPVYLRASGA